MEETMMDNKFFCSANIRPEFCYVDSNTCCLHCEHLEKCIINNQEYNLKNIKKSVIPCTSKIISKNEICEFAC